MVGGQKKGGKLPPLGRILLLPRCTAPGIGKDPLPWDMYLVIPEVSLSFVLRVLVVGERGDYAGWMEEVLKRLFLMVQWASLPASKLYL